MFSFFSGSRCRCRHRGVRLITLDNRLARRVSIFYSDGFDDEWFQD
jgi:hypothetical protein